MEKQNVITETLVKQTLKSSLPTRTIPVFSGNSLEYKLFVRAFEHGVEDKTDSCKDRIYYLEQYTSGEAKDLVRSCLCLDSSVGYNKSKDLLKENFGSEYKIATSFVEKALNWPVVRSEDADALKMYSLFLLGCQNTLSDMDLNELDHPSNIRELVGKLPFKLMSAWRKKAFETTDGAHGRQVKFKDIVIFVSRESRILNEPILVTFRINPAHLVVKVGRRQEPKVHSKNPRLLLLRR
jgi:hypothetical protein